MPIYIYKCENCEESIKVSHSMTETMDYCEVCESIGTLVRKPSMFFNSKKKPKHKIGSCTEEFIKDAKKDLEQQKKELRSKND